MATKRKRLVRGKDWHGWAWEPGKADSDVSPLLWWAEAERPKLCDSRPTTTGKWVKVKFVKVK